MAIITPSAARNFVARTKLPPAPSPSRRARALRGETEAPAPPKVTLQTSDPQSLVVGSGLVVAAANVPKSTREDLINCTLFAQLAASGDVQDSADVTAWYGAYFRALSILGWAQSDSSMADYQFDSANGEANEAVIPVLTTLLGPQAAALLVVEAALRGLKEMSENSPWLTLFDQQSRVERAARFQVATADMVANGPLEIALAAFDLKLSAKQTQVLFFRFVSSSTSLRYSAGRATIYEAALSDQREALRSRLEPYRAAYVAQVKLPPLPTPPAQRGTRAPAKGELRPRTARHR